jgi:hypothetical protein
MTTQSQKQPTAPANTSTHWRKVHRRQNENLLFAEDLNGLKSVDVEVVGSGVIKAKTSDGKGKAMPFLEFRGKKKVLGLNATNCKAMEAMTGTGIVETWRGWITLTVVRTKYKDMKTGRDEETDAIRIAPRRPKGKEVAEETQRIDARHAANDEARRIRQELEARLLEARPDLTDDESIGEWSEEDIQAEIELAMSAREPSGNG